jgi:hypothetical protein
MLKWQKNVHIMCVKRCMSVAHSNCIIFWHYMRLPKLLQQQGKHRNLPFCFHFLLFNMQSSEDDVIQVGLGVNCMVNDCVECCQNVLYHMPHHVIFLLVIMIHTSSLSSCIPILLDSLSSPIHVTLCNIIICPFLQKMTLHFHTTQYKTFPIYQFATSSLSQSRNNHIYFSSYSFHPTLISTSLVNNIYAIWQFELK